MKNTVKKLASIVITAIMAVTAFVVPASAADAKIAAPAKIGAAAKSSTSIKVAWSAVTDAVKYIIYSSSDGKNYKTYGSTTKTSATVKKLTANTKYYFRVKAVDASGNKSALSKAAKATTKAEETSLSVVSAPGKVKNGKTATLKIKGKPNTEYSVSVQYKTKKSDAKGIGKQTTDADGYATFSWKVGTNTTAGKHPIYITGGGETLTTEFETYKK